MMIETTRIPPQQYVAQGSAVGHGDSNSSNNTRTWSRPLTSYTFDRVNANTDFKGRKR